MTAVTLPVVLLFLAAAAGGVLAGCEDWQPSVGHSEARDGLRNAMQAVTSDCPASGRAVLRGGMVRLRSGGGGHCSWELRAGGGSGGSGGSRPLCRLRVEALSLRLPCDRGALTVAGELLCGGHQGARTIRLSEPADKVDVHYTSVSPVADEFEAVILLEECGASDALAEATSDVDCGGLYPVSPGEAVGLLSPGYPARYPHNKQCLFALVPRSETHPPACFLDLHFADFNLAGSAAGGCASGDRLVVEGVPGAVFCDRRTGRARLALPPSKTGVPVNEGTPAVRLRFLSDGQGSGPGFRVLATLAPCEAAANDDGREEDILPVLAVDNDIVGNGSAGAASASLGVPFPYPSPQQLPQCCGRVHVGPSLFLTSPGFPVGLASSSECVFPVARLSPLTCRLRLVLHQFLLLGASLGACEKHFLQVDGRRLCGCRSRGQVVSYFRPGESVKLLRYYRHPLATGAFIAEVIQEDCASPVAGVPWARSVDDRDALWSNGLSPRPWSISNVTSDIKRADFLVRFPGAVSSEDWGSLNGTRGPQLPPNGAQDGDPPRGYRPAEDVHRDPSAFDAAPSDCCSQDAEAVPEAVGEAGVEAGVSSAALGVVPVCGAPSYKDWMAAAAAWASTVPPALLQCPVGIFPPAKCRELRGPTGLFASPRYPGLYPNNVRACYRIVRYPEQCSVQVSFLDFDVEPSPTCSKDYVSLGAGTRYCGAQLASTLIQLNFQDSQYIDILFITDGAIAARGFRASYRQFACGVIASPGFPGAFGGSLPGAYPGVAAGAVPGAGPVVPGLAPGVFPGGYPGGGAVYPGVLPGALPGGLPGVLPGAGYFPRPVPVEEAGPYQASGQPERQPRPPYGPPGPPTTPAPRTTPTPPPTVCGGDVRQQHFALGLQDVAGHSECVFTVRRVSKDICGLQLLVERMDLDCRRESLVASDRTLCGRDAIGQTVMVDFYGDTVQILYLGDTGGDAVPQSDFLVHAQQVADCLDLDVTPVARVGQAAPDDYVPPPACVVILDDVRGALVAPALEPRSPHHLACSYQFRRRPGRCSLRLQFHDFALAPEPAGAAGGACDGSYLSLRNHKYCGEDLVGTTHGLPFTGPTIELPYRLHRDLAFARWNVSYAQMPC